MNHGTISTDRVSRCCSTVEVVRQNPELSESAETSLGGIVRTRLGGISRMDILLESMSADERALLDEVLYTRCGPQPVRMDHHLPGSNTAVGVAAAQGGGREGERGRKAGVVAAGERGRKPGVVVAEEIGDEVAGGGWTTEDDEMRTNRRRGEIVSEDCGEEKTLNTRGEGDAPPPKSSSRTTNCSSGEEQHVLVEEPVILDEHVMLLDEHTSEEADALLDKVLAPEDIVTSSIPYRDTEGLEDLD